MNRTRWIAVALAGVFLFAACANDDTPAEPAAEPQTQEPASGEIAVTATDYSFGEIPDEIAAGETTITFENAGEEPHELALGELLEGKTIEDVQALLEEGVPNQPPSWFRDVAHTFAKPGQEGKPITADLEAGTYVMLCFVPSEENDGTPHAMLGMVEDFTVV